MHVGLKLQPCPDYLQLCNVLPMESIEESGVGIFSVQGASEEELTFDRGRFLELLLEACSFASCSFLACSFFSFSMPAFLSSTC